MITSEQQECLELLKKTNIIDNAGFITTHIGADASVTNIASTLIDQLIESKAPQLFDTSDKVQQLKRLETRKAITALLKSDVIRQKAKQQSKKTLKALTPWPATMKISDEQFIMQSVRYVDTTTGDVLHYHPDLKIQRRVCDAARQIAMNKHLTKEELKEWEDLHTEVVTMTYNPEKKNKLFISESGGPVFNMYQRPQYTPDMCPSGKCPEPIIEHLRYMLTPTDPSMHLYAESLRSVEDSIDYILDWCAGSIKSRNITWLLLIGEGGAGKNIFGDVMLCVHNGCSYEKLKELNDLDNNAVIIPGQRLGNGFDEELFNKRFVFIDECKLNTEEKIQAMKVMAATTVTINPKGLRARTVQNVMSFMTASNKLDAVELEEGQRRISWIDIFGRNLTDIYSSDQLDKYVIRLRNCWKEFGAYLVHHHVPKFPNAGTVPRITPRGRFMASVNVPNWIEEATDWANQNPECELLYSEWRRATGIKVNRRTMIKDIKEYGLRNVISLTTGKENKVKSMIGRYGPFNSQYPASPDSLLSMAGEKDDAEDDVYAKLKNEMLAQEAAEEEGE